MVPNSKISWFFRFLLIWEYESFRKKNWANLKIIDP
jgi:hypothetical protein